jgi:predicted enzyme related to lactoylglutathione lyase
MAADWPRPVVHWELIARDPEAQADFYRRMFNWDIGAGDLEVVPGQAEHQQLDHSRELRLDQMTSWAE